MEINQSNQIEDSNLKTSLFSCSSSNSSHEPRENENENIYYYINKDGARITLFKNFGHVESKLISKRIAYQYYKMSTKKYSEYLEWDKLDWDKKGVFEKVDCDIKNKITVKELIENFKGEKWIAKKYNLLMHNCQTFAAKIIKILKAVRINEEDKLRVVEKTKLPGCIINALWHNEELSLKNTLGRIPIFGLFHDIINPK